MRRIGKASCVIKAMSQKKQGLFKEINAGPVEPVHGDNIHNVTLERSNHRGLISQCSRHWFLPRVMELA